MMAEVKHRLPAVFSISGATFAAELELNSPKRLATTDAACVLLCAGGTADPTSMRGPRADRLVQARGLACLIEHDAALAERLGADGVHIAADASLYRQRASFSAKAQILALVAA